MRTTLIALAAALAFLPAVASAASITYKIDAPNSSGLIGSTLFSNQDVSFTFTGDPANFVRVAPGESFGSIGGLTGSASIGSSTYSISGTWSLDDSNTIATFLYPTGSTVSSETISDNPDLSTAFSHSVPSFGTALLSTSGGELSYLQAPFTDGNPSLTTFSSVITAGGVPEPASWAMMIAGLGLIGATLRRRKSLSCAAS